MFGSDVLLSFVDYFFSFFPKTIQQQPMLAYYYLSERFLIPYLFSAVAKSPIFVFSLLFFLDSDKSPKQLLFSWLRAVKMVLYNFPICFVVTITYISLKRLIDYYIWSIDPATLYWKKLVVLEQIPSVDGSLLLDPIIVCIFANIYIKKLHEQFGVYFERSA